VRRLAAVEMLVEVGHEPGPGQVRHRHDQIVIDIAGPSLQVSASVEVAALGLVLAPRIGYGPGRSVPVFLDGHRPVGDPQEVFEATRVLADSLGMMAGEVSVGPGGRGHDHSPANRAP
jgi:hypothetical protein